MKVFACATLTVASTLAIKIEERASYERKVFRKGECPTLELMGGADGEGVDLERLEGDWFTRASMNMAHFTPLSCIHSVCEFDPETDSFHSAIEMNLGTQKWVISDITSKYTAPNYDTYLFDEKLRISSGILATDYDTYSVDYACFDGMQLEMEEGQDPEPVHYLVMSLSVRDPNDRKVDRKIETALKDIPHLSKEDFDWHAMGDKHCDYTLLFEGEDL